VLLISLLISWGISRIIESPLQKMFVAAQDIASGQYHQRIPLSFEPQKTNLDPIQKLAIGFNQMAASLEETEQMRQQLIGDISHELRTPLTTIKGSMEGLIDGVVQGNEQTYQQLYQEADRLQRLVDDLQELSRIEGGAYHLNPQWISIPEIFQSISTKYDYRFQEKQVQFSISIPEPNTTIFVDPDRLEQVLVNLLMNALQFTDPGDSVSLSAQQHRNVLKIQVQDTGSGIASEHLPHIFTRFYRVDKSRSRQSGGSGIGLTISKHLVEAHGGTITVTSPGPGLGSTFEIKLPVENKKEKQA
jgi:histidine kinase